jgi:ABC transporter substrate binding protein
VLFALWSFAEAQQPGKIARIGYLDASTASGSAVLLEAFGQEMRKLGWIEGKNLGSPVMVNNRQHIADLAIKHRLPAVFWQKEHAEAGALMAYGSPFTDTFRRAAYFVDRILKGAKPADLPVGSQPSLSW